MVNEEEKELSAHRIKAEPKPQETDDDDEGGAPATKLPEAIPAQSEVNLEDAFSNLFKSSVSGTGEEELLRIASNYSLQITAPQIKILLYLEHKAETFDLAYTYAKTTQLQAKYRFIANYLRMFVRRWLELKQHNNSDIFVMRALDSISLRKFINENTLKVNIEK